MTRWRWIRTIMMSVSLAFSASRLPIWTTDATAACMIAVPVIGMLIIAVDQKELDARRGGKRRVDEDRKCTTFNLHSTTF